VEVGQAGVRDALARSYRGWRFASTGRSPKAMTATAITTATMRERRCRRSQREPIRTKRQRERPLEGGRADEPNSVEFGYSVLRFYPQKRTRRRTLDEKRSAPE
jgi:hypothetical protein